MTSVQEAAARLRKYSGQSIAILEMLPTDDIKAAWLLAGQWLAAVPADDAELITPEFLKSVGGSKDEHPHKWTFYRDSGLPIGLWDVSDGWKVMLLHSDAVASCIVRGLKTRGDIRALLKGLKLPLSQSPARQEPTQ